MVDRRRFLLGAGAAILAAPSLSTLRIPDLSALDLFGFPGDPNTKPYPVNRTLDRLLEGGRGANPFVAHAAKGRIVEVGSTRVLPAPRALRGIFDDLNIDWHLRDCICYCEAEWCESQFRGHEPGLRERYNAFAGVKRSPVEENVAYVVGADSTTEPTSAAAATQYGPHPAVVLSGKDPGLVRVASDLINKEYEPSPQEVARSFAVVAREPYYQGGTRVGTRYETPVSSFVHYWRGSAGAPQGYLHMHNNLRQDDIVYESALYA